MHVSNRRWKRRNWSGGGPANHLHRKRVAILRCQPIDGPGTVRLQGIAKSIVQAILTPLPEFNFVCLDAVSSPVIGKWHLTGLQLLFKRFELIQQKWPRSEHLALLWSDGRYLTVAGTWHEILEGFRGGNLSGDSTHFYLAIGIVPGEMQAYFWIAIQL